MYQYDRDNNITAQYTDFGSPGGWSVYTYDADERLASWSDPSSILTNYTNDGAGNRLTAGPKTFTYDGQNRLTSGAGTTYNWTDRGTLASTITAGVTTTVTADVFGLETQHGTTTYTYDGLERIARRNGTGGWFGYDDIGQNSIADGTWTTLTDPTGLPLSMKQTGKTADWVATNLHQDIIGLLNPALTGTDYATRYDPFGVPVAQTGIAPSSGYHSDWTDPTTTEVDMGARFYQPTGDTFTSRDDVNGDPSAPVALNEYTYANDNPITNFDTDGHSAAPTTTVESTPGYVEPDYAHGTQEQVEATENADIQNFKNYNGLAIIAIGINNHATIDQIEFVGAAYDANTIEPAIANFQFSVGIKFLAANPILLTSAPKKPAAFVPRPTDPHGDWDKGTVTERYASTTLQQVTAIPPRRLRTLQWTRSNAIRSSISLSSGRTTVATSRPPKI